jgi:hypothetical protein
MTLLASYKLYDAACNPHSVGTKLDQFWAIAYNKAQTTRTILRLAHAANRSQTSAHQR